MVHHNTLNNRIMMLHDNLEFLNLKHFYQNYGEKAKKGKPVPLYLRFDFQVFNFEKV